MRRRTTTDDAFGVLDRLRLFALKEEILPISCLVDPRHGANELRKRKETTGPTGTRTSNIAAHLASKNLSVEKAAKKVSKQLRGQVKLKVNKDGDRSGLKAFLNQHLSGRRDQITQAVEKDDFSISAFAKACLAGELALTTQVGLSANQAANLAGLTLEVRLQIAELDLSSTTEVSLNVAAEGQPDEWKVLDDLSKGQKATALLLLLLLQSSSPLIVDQPEDDLDNRFVSSGVVPRIRISKKHRQFLFATHNANIPVLGDAELIAVLSASGEAGSSGQGRLDAAQMGVLITPKRTSKIHICIRRTDVPVIIKIFIIGSNSFNYGIYNCE